MRPKRPCMCGGGLPSGSLNAKSCIKLVNIRNISILANCSPMHTLRPVTGGQAQFFVQYAYKIIANLNIESKLNVLKHTYTKWNKTFLPEKLSFFVQKSRWIKIIRIFPYTGISVYRPEVWDDDCAFRNSVPSELWDDTNVAKMIYLDTVVTLDVNTRTLTQINILHHQLDYGRGDIDLIQFYLLIIYKTDSKTRNERDDSMFDFTCHVH